MEWMRVQRRDLWRFSSRRHQVHNTDLPLFRGCHSVTCKKYRMQLESSINRSQNPCKDFYQFACDGWKNHVLSVVDVAQDIMYTNALNAVERAFGLGNDTATSSAPSVWKRVAALVMSCMENATNSLNDLKTFMAERHLPWPAASPKDLFEILLDFSGKWNVRLWFQATLDLAPYRSGRGEPLLKIGKSATFRAWVALTRTVTGQRTGTPPSLRYQASIRSLLGLFGVSQSRSEDLTTAIQDMIQLTLQVSEPAVLYPEHKILRMSIQNTIQTANPSIPAPAHWLPLLNERFPWARRFSANNEVQVENRALLRAFPYLVGRKAETREALTLSLGLRVVSELGWMADKGIAGGTLELMGLPWSAHTRRCLVRVECTIGVAWSTLFPQNLGAEALVQNVRDILVHVVMRRSKAMLYLKAKNGPVLWNIGSYLPDVLPEHSPGASFFISWKDLIQWRLQQHGLTKVMTPRFVLSHTCSAYGILPSEECFAFPLYHTDLPPAINYGGVARLLADEVLRGLLYESFRDQPAGQYLYVGDGSESDPSMSLPEWSTYNVRTKAPLAALKAQRLGLQRRSTEVRSRQSRLAASCYAPSSSGNYIVELYGDASRLCNVAAEALRDFRAAFECDIPKH